MAVNPGFRDEHSAACGDSSSERDFGRASVSLQPVRAEPKSSEFSSAPGAGSGPGSLDIKKPDRPPRFAASRYRRAFL